MSGIAVRSTFAALPGEGGVKGNVFTGQDVLNMLLGRKKYFMRAKKLQTAQKLVARLERKIGIETRNILDDRSVQYPTTFLLAEAGKGVLAKANVDPKAVQGLIVATDTPDFVFPSAGIAVAKLLEINPRQFGNASMACVSIADILERASGWIDNNWCDNVLVLAGDVTSRMRLPQNRVEPFLFGDGAVGIYIEKGKTSEDGSKAEKGGFAFSNVSVDTSHSDLFVHKPLYASDINSLFSSNLLTSLQDNDTGLNILGDIDAYEIAFLLLDWLNNSGDEIDENTKIILPQTGKQVTESGIEKFKELTGIDITPNVVENTAFKKHGNIGAGAIPLVWHEAIQSGVIKPTDTVIFVIAGVGGVKTVFKRDPKGVGVEHISNFSIHERPDYQALIAEEAAIAEEKAKKNNKPIRRLTEIYNHGNNGTLEIDFRPVRKVENIERVVKSVSASMKN